MVTSKDQSRRSFLSSLAFGMTAIGAGTSGWAVANSFAKGPFSADESPVIFDLNSLPYGTEVLIAFNGGHYIIRHRTKEEITVARSVELADLPDKNSRNENFLKPMPALDRYRSVDEEGRYIVLSAKPYSRYGAIVSIHGRHRLNFDQNSWWWDSIRANHFDTSGRFLRGIDPHNMPIPLYQLLPGNRIKLLRNNKDLMARQIDSLIYGENRKVD